jgi:uncharacterized protein YdcH (DUF465 family)
VQLGLIEEIQQGQGKPNKIYVLKFILNEDVEKRDFKLDDQIEENIDDEIPENLKNTETIQNEWSRPFKNKIQDHSKWRGNNTEKIDTNLVINQSVSQKIINLTNITEMEDFFKENIMYDSMIIIHDKKIIDEIILNILEMYFKPITIINKTEMPRELVQSVMMKLEAAHIDSIAEKYKSINTEIKNKKNYLQTTIYNTVFESEIDNKQLMVKMNFYNSKT